MDVATKIQIAVAKADLFVSTALRYMGIIVLLTVILFAVLLAFWSIRPDPYLIDYDAPGVDITSEGPEDDDPWYYEGGD